MAINSKIEMKHVHNNGSFDFDDVKYEDSVAQR